jgi:lipopolysaccharide/colanic/teichoic acid biosynthesis glycosyltransferase
MIHQPVTADCRSIDGNLFRLNRRLSRVEEFRNAFPGCSPKVLRGILRRKRRFDLLLSGLIAIPAIPLVLLCMLLVKLTSRGPALYSQKRVGQFGHVFTIYKIRTMYHNCERTSGPQWCLPKDPRVTWLGRILRNLHVDELPQLWNVFRGEMSLIGPRPERPEIAGKLREDILQYDWRVAVRPGISGLAQIHLPPDTSVHSVRNKLVLDRTYIRSVSLRLDLTILFRTAGKVLGITPVRRAN